MIEDKFIVCLHNSNFHTGYFWEKKPYKNEKGEKKLTVHDAKCLGEKIPEQFHSINEYLRKYFSNQSCDTIECAI